MSLKNHPNFHAVQFVTDVTASFYESLRGKANSKKITSEVFDKLQNHIIEFVDQIENFVDNEIASLQEKNI